MFNVEKNIFLKITALKQFLFFKIYVSNESQFFNFIFDQLNIIFLKNPFL